MLIRNAEKQDDEAVWDIFRPVIAGGDTYVFAPDMPKEDLQQHWFAPYMHTYVAEVGGSIKGTYIIKANQLGLGSHIANASYMVHPSAHGQGIGKQLCLHSLEQARQLGFTAMQFNLVVSTNTVAVSLWKKMGFSIIGSVPQGFRHQRLGLVDAYIMYRTL